MVRRFADRPIMYTVLSEERAGLVDALEALRPEAFEVIIHPDEETMGTETMRSESIEGAVTAVNDLDGGWDHAIIRVYGEAGSR